LIFKEIAMDLVLLIFWPVLIYVSYIGSVWALNKAGKL